MLLAAPAIYPLVSTCTGQLRAADGTNSLGTNRTKQNKKQEQQQKDKVNKPDLSGNNCIKHKKRLYAVSFVLSLPTSCWPMIVPCAYPVANFIVYSQLNPQFARGPVSSQVTPHSLSKFRTFLAKVCGDM